MFLIDPYIPILSTANVPPQSKAWWSEEVRKIPLFDSLPKELFDMIIDSVEGFPISWEKATSIREDLMKERSAVNKGVEESMTKSVRSIPCIE
jgi:hypothetical protein